ncbi:MAG TPA: GntR family transcriptional regulator [bacterium]|nr:GntR family transcriptional regulator [bacterium]HPP30012.1 GntR family transcriptional regulator [bacterium]
MKNITKRDLVKNYILDEIRYGILKGGERLLSEEALVKRYGVSRVTVRSALSELLKENFIFKEKGRKGYFVSPGKALKGKRLYKSIGILIHYSTEKSHPFMHRFLTSASLQCAEENIGHQIFNLINNVKDNIFSDEISKILNVMKEYPVDGLLINSRLCDETLEKIEKIGIPVVLVNNFLPGSEIPHIIAGYRAVGNAVTHLWRIGHRRIGFITGPQDERIVHETIWDFQETCKRLALPYDISLIKEVAYDEGRLKKAIEEFLSVRPSPTALVIDDDIMACYAIGYLKEKGVKVPDDMGIVGMGGVEMGEFISPPLTTVSLPIEKAARIGVEMLAKLIKGENLVKKFIHLKGELIVRKSCGSKK